MVTVGALNPSIGCVACILNYQSNEKLLGLLMPTSQNKIVAQGASVKFTVFDSSVGFSRQGLIQAHPQ